MSGSQQSRGRILGLVFSSSGIQKRSDAFKLLLVSQLIQLLLRLIESSDLLSRPFGVLLRSVIFELENALSILDGRQLDRCLAIELIAEQGVRERALIRPVELVQTFEVILEILVPFGPLVDCYVGR